MPAADGMSIAVLPRPGTDPAPGCDTRGKRKPLVPQTNRGGIRRVVSRLGAPLPGGWRTNILAKG